MNTRQDLQYRPGNTINGNDDNNHKNDDNDDHDNDDDNHQNQQQQDEGRYKGPVVLFAWVLRPKTKPATDGTRFLSRVHH